MDLETGLLKKTQKETEPEFSEALAFSASLSQFGQTFCVNAELP
jgi:hypothetical protein